MRLFFLVFPRGVFIQFFFYRQSCACGEANRSTKVFSGDFRLHAPPLFIGILIFIQ